MGEDERGGMGGGDGAWARKKMSHFGTTTIVVAAFIQFPLYGGGRRERGKVKV
jgi:hypothetical protein